MFPGPTHSNRQAPPRHPFPRVQPPAADGTRPSKRHMSGRSATPPNGLDEIDVASSSARDAITAGPTSTSVRAGAAPLPFPPSQSAGYYQAVTHSDGIVSIDSARVYIKKLLRARRAENRRTVWVAHGRHREISVRSPEAGRGGVVLRIARDPHVRVESELWEFMPLAWRFGEAARQQECYELSVQYLSPATLQQAVSAAFVFRDRLRVEELTVRDRLGLRAEGGLANAACTTEGVAAVPPSSRPLDLSQLDALGRMVVDRLKTMHEEEMDTDDEQQDTPDVAVDIDIDNDTALAPPPPPSAAAAAAAAAPASGNGDTANGLPRQEWEAGRRELSIHWAGDVGRFRVQTSGHSHTMPGLRSLSQQQVETVLTTLYEATQMRNALFEQLGWRGRDISNDNISSVLTEVLEDARSELDRCVADEGRFFGNTLMLLGVFDHVDGGRQAVKTWIGDGQEMAAIAKKALERLGEGDVLVKHPGLGAPADTTTRREQGGGSRSSPSPIPAADGDSPQSSRDEPHPDQQEAAGISWQAEGNYFRVVTSLNPQSTIRKKRHHLAVKCGTVRCLARALQSAVDCWNREAARALTSRRQDSSGAQKDEQQDARPKEYFTFIDKSSVLSTREQQHYAVQLLSALLNQLSAAGPLGGFITWDPAPRHFRDEITAQTFPPRDSTLESLLAALRVAMVAWLAKHKKRAEGAMAAVRARYRVAVDGQGMVQMAMSTIAEEAEQVRICVQAAMDTVEATNRHRADQCRRHLTRKGAQALSPAETLDFAREIMGDLQMYDSQLRIKYPDSWINTGEIDQDSQSVTAFMLLLPSDLTFTHESISHVFRAPFCFKVPLTATHASVMSAFEAAVDVRNCLMPLFTLQTASDALDEVRGCQHQGGQQCMAALKRRFNADGVARLHAMMRQREADMRRQAGGVGSKRSRTPHGPTEDGAARPSVSVDASDMSLDHSVAGYDLTTVAGSQAAITHIAHTLLDRLRAQDMHHHTHRQQQQQPGSHPVDQLWRGKYTFIEWEGGTPSRLWGHFRVWVAIHPSPQRRLFRVAYKTVQAVQRALNAAAAFRDTQLDELEGIGREAMVHSDPSAEVDGVTSAVMECVMAARLDTPPSAALNTAARPFSPRPHPPHLPLPSQTADGHAAAEPAAPPPAAAAAAAATTAAAGGGGGPTFGGGMHRQGPMGAALAGDANGMVDDGERGLLPNGQPNIHGLDAAAALSGMLPGGSAETNPNRELDDAGVSHVAQMMLSVANLTNKDKISARIQHPIEWRVDLRAFIVRYRTASGEDKVAYSSIAEKTFAGVCDALGRASKYLDDATKGT
ncbi:unnamed protein product [Vitrella brassicaformis CCMP3155]|uniref:Uncharacterized protein n=3 Tax=Vitrella brassicaformis TaxID=1169539 RepID=A0A0G4F1W7_VITBC|nr:unnamed protein product [Vitrella brassicaformis CCMP3155]|eukprot:CEM05845.1 unnamed protein product [Vitrella brassicaformis CCMP3155]